MDVDISMDIHVKSVDMDMEEKFHIPGKPGVLGWGFGWEPTTAVNILTNEG